MRCRAGEAENPDEKSVISMELTPAHLRYLLAIYEVSQTHLDILSWFIDKIFIEPLAR